MAEPEHNNAETTAVDDVRRVREKIARQHAGDLRKHIEETNRIAAELRAKLHINMVDTKAPPAKRAGTGE